MTEINDPYLEVTPENGARFFSTAREGEVVMLNLLRFREFADYSHAPEMEPEGGVSGAAAYRLYMEQIEPMLIASGGSIAFAGEAGHFLIGPAQERWDYAVLVRQASAQRFLQWASDPAAQTATHHRTAAIADSRLLPLWPEPPAP